MIRLPTSFKMSVASAALIVFSTGIPAQPPGSVPPPYSPYLNLTRPGNVATNYYGLVRPEMQFRNSIQGLQSQYSNLNQAITDRSQAGGPGAFRATGHPTAFMNYGRYYALRGRSPLPGAGGPIGGGAAPASLPPRR